MEERIVQETVQKNAVQEVIDVPFIGDTIGLIIGLFPPFFLAIYFVPYDQDNELQKIKSNLLMSFSMFVWTFFLYFVLRVKVAFPLVKIPLFVFGILGCAYQLYKYFTL
jgi:hypothetical protein